jgi:hypothetical protein
LNLVPDNGRTDLLVMLVAFVATFAATRAVTRLIRSGRGPFGDVGVGGLHVHHLVPGIFLMLVAGALDFSVVPHSTWRHVFAGAFGVGAALTLDEFALWLHLDDVYWAEEGRQSVDAVVFAAGIGLVTLAASNPFARAAGESRLLFGLYVAVNLVLALVAVLKGRLFLGVGGVLMPLLAVVGAVRLARPGSPWFRRFYRSGTSKHARAVRRAQAGFRIERVADRLSGLPQKRRRS